MESNNIKLNPGDVIKINYEINFQNTKLEEVTINLEKLGKIIKETTQKELNLYCWTKKSTTNNQIK